MDMGLRLDLGLGRSSSTGSSGGTLANLQFHGTGDFTVNCVKTYNRSALFDGVGDMQAQRAGSMPEFLGVGAMSARRSVPPFIFSAEGGFDAMQADAAHTGLALFEGAGGMQALRTVPPLMFSGTGGFDVVEVTPPALSFSLVDAPAIVDHGFSSTPVTFSDMNFGTPSAGRILVIAVTQINGTTTSLTIGGIAATERVAASLTKNYTAAVPTGTSGDVVVTLTAARNIGISVYNMVGYTQTPSNTLTEPFAFLPDPQIFSGLTVPTDGVSIFVAGSAAGDRTPTWSQDVVASAEIHSGTQLAHMTALGNTTGAITAQLDGFNYGGVGMVAGAWTPIP